MQDFSSTLPYSRIFRQLSGIACAALFLVACSSGGGDGGGGTSPAASSSSGTFVDSPVQGLGYQALPSGLVGKTDATGHYQYMPGDMVTFNLGGRPIGLSVTAVPQVTALSIFGAASVSDLSVVNLSRVLLTLGGPPNNNNVIVLPSPLPANLPQILPNFSDQTATFEAKLLAAGFQLTFSDMDASAHLHTSFKTLAVTVDHSGTVTSNPAGINCTTAGTCSFAFVAGTIVTLTAIGNGFTGWSGAGCSGTGTCVVTMNADTAVTAPFPVTPLPATLTILLNQGTGSGAVACSANGGAFVACAPSYSNGPALVLQATASADSTFSGWTNGTGNATVCNNTIVDCSMPALIADSAVTANFVLNTQTFTLSTNTTTSNGNGGGGSIECSTTGGAPFGVCAPSYNAGTNLTLQATSDNASNFTGWSASVCSGTGPCQFTLAANSSITANFNRPRLTVVLVGIGTVTSTNIAGINCGPTCTAPFDKNTTITLTVNGTGFSGWSGGGCSGSSSTCQVSLTANTTVTASFAPTTNGYIYPLKVDPTSRYLVDQKGKPFLLVGDAAWSLFAALSDEDADVYLESRHQLGFTAVLANLIEHQFAAVPPANAYGDRPFTGQAFTTLPREAYFAHVDHIVQSAATKGIVILLDPLYLGFDCGSQGWCQEVQAANTSDMMAWGHYVGNRYKDYANIVWVIGGDTDPRLVTGVKNKVQAMVDEIRSVDPNHLFTAHNAPEQMAVEPWSGADWLNVNNVYTYNGVAYQSIRSAYATSPTKPVFLIEAAYESEHAVSAQELRAQSYWTVLSGGFGHVFGNCPIWGFGFASGFCSSTDWKAELQNTGSVNMQHFQALFNSRHWHTLVPDTLQTILTAGYGTFENPDYAQAACAADGSSILAYLPSARTISVNGACLAGNTMTAWWYKPGDGTANQIGTYPTTGTQDFTPLSSGDWVLVLDSTNFSFPAPGQ